MTPDRPGAWARWLNALLLFYPRRFRARFGADLRAHYRQLGAPSLSTIVAASRDLIGAGLGARFDDARSAWAAGARGGGLDGLRVDIRHAARGLARRPLFAGAIVATLALAAALNGAVFSIVDTAFMRPLPFHDAERIVSIGSRWTGFDHSAVSVPEYADYRDRNRTLASIALYTNASFNVLAADGPERMLGARVTASFFDVLGVAPAIGRVFTPEEERPGSTGVVVLSHGFWLRRFGGDRAIVGRTLTFDFGPRTIIGVMPPEFRFPAAETEVWIPMWINPASPGPRGNHNREIVARIKAGQTLARVRTEMHGIGLQIQREHPEVYANGSGWDVSVRGLREHLFGDFRTPLMLLMAAVLFVLLIACTNVASLMVARATEREHELATRAALGAPAFRLIRQALIEGLFLGVAGGAAGLALASALVTVLQSQLPDRLPVPDHLLGDARVIVFGLTVTAGAGVLTALTSIGARDLTRILGTHRSSSDGRSQRVRAALTVAEIAIATMLLVAGGVAFRSFARLVRADPGVSIEGIATARVTALERYRSREELAGLFERIATNLSDTPGVAHAGFVSMLPLSGDIGDRGFAIEGQTLPGQPLPDEQMRAVGGDYFQVMGIPLVAGRFFDTRDNPQGQPVAIVSALAARKYWGHENPIGRRINFGGLNTTEPWTVIVGVVGDIRHRGLDSAFVPVVYLPAKQFPERSMTVVARLEPRQRTANVIADAVDAVDRQQPIFVLRMMDEWVTRSVAEPRFSLLLLGLFAGLSVALAAVGVYGVMASMVTRRTRELGIRLALGGQPASLLRLVLGRGLSITGIGVVTGLGAGFATSTALRATFADAHALDPILLLVVIVLVLTVSFAASYLPARRAMRVDPVEALRM